LIWSLISPVTFFFGAMCFFLVVRHEDALPTSGLFPDAVVVDLPEGNRASLRGNQSFVT
jgi:hypothetical protein